MLIVTIGLMKILRLGEYKLMSLIIYMDLSNY